MFVYDFVTLDRPYANVAGVLINDRGAGALTCAVMGVSAAADANADAVRFEVGTARSVTGTVVVPIRWSPGSGGGPFRHLEGALHLEPFESDGSYLSLSANYDEPTTGLGRHEDTRRRQRDAEVSVRTFLRELVVALENGLERQGGSEQCA